MRDKTPFNLYVPVRGGTEKRIINIEIQNNFSPGYPLENRAEFLQGEIEGLKENKLMNIIMMNLGKPEECTGVFRMLAVALSDELSAKEKKDILEKEYGIKLNQREEEEMKDMCDLADAIERKGIEKGKNLEKISLLIKLLKIKLGNLRNETVICIKNASHENLERLAERLLSIESEEEIQNILINS